MISAELIVPQDHQSIFSDTVHGVPSPTIPHEHPYPTRYHGPIYHYPRFFLPYREQSYVVPPEWTGPGLKPKWPDSIPFGEPIFGSVTGSSLIDAAIGGAIGYAVAKDPKDRLLWAGGGAAAGVLAGTLGLLGLVGAAIWVRR